MTKLITSFLLLFLFTTAHAQLTSATAKGKRVYVENKSKNDNAIKTRNNLVENIYIPTLGDAFDFLKSLYLKSFKCSINEQGKIYQIQYRGTRCYCIADQAGS